MPGVRCGRYRRGGVRGRPAGELDREESGLGSGGVSRWECCGERRRVGGIHGPGNETFFWDW